MYFLKRTNDKHARINMRGTNYSSQNIDFANVNMCILYNNKLHFSLYYTLVKTEIFLLPAKISFLTQLVKLRKLEFTYV